MPLVLPRDEYNLLRKLATDLNVLMATAKVGEITPERIYTLSPGEVQQLTSWLQHPNGAFFPVADSSVVLESVEGGSLMIRVRRY